MLKRCQIILNDWMIEHYKSIADTYDVSFSEMIRMALCVDILNATRTVFPKHRYKLNENILKKVINERAIVKLVGRDQFHKFLSELYFETRKAATLWKK